MSLDIDSGSVITAAGALSGAADTLDELAKGDTPTPDAGIATALVGAILGAFATAGAELVEGGYTLASAASTAAGNADAADQAAAEAFFLKRADA